MGNALHMSGGRVTTSKNYEKTVIPNELRQQFLTLLSTHIMKSVISPTLQYTQKCEDNLSVSINHTQVEMEESLPLDLSAKSMVLNSKGKVSNDLHIDSNEEKNKKVALLEEDSNLLDNKEPALLLEK